MPDLRSELIAISSSSAPVRQTDRRAATSHNEPHTRGSTLPFPHLTFCKSIAHAILQIRCFCVPVLDSVPQKYGA
jgi:hypothetical protein